MSNRIDRKKRFAQVLKQLTQKLQKELGPDDHERLLRKARVAVRELNTRPLNRKRLDVVLSTLLNEFVSRGSGKADK